jgi:hypothetical protein
VFEYDEPDPFVAAVQNSGMFEMTISEHACFDCDKIVYFINGKEIGEPCEHRKAAKAMREAELDAEVQSWRDREPLL